MQSWTIPLPHGARLVIEADFREALLLLEEREKRMKNLRPVLERIAALMREELGARFEDAGQGTWQPLAASTIAGKRMAAGLPLVSKSSQNGGSSAYGPGGILVRSGALRDAYRNRFARGHLERIDEKEASVEVGANLSVGNGVNLAAIHQYGTSSYVIRAKLARALAFPGSAGETVLRRAVQHPGLHARPVFISRAGVERIVEAFLDHLDGKETVHAT